MLFVVGGGMVFFMGCLLVVCEIGLSGCCLVELLVLLCERRVGLKFCFNCVWGVCFMRWFGWVAMLGIGWRCVVFVYGMVLFAWWLFVLVE